MATVVIVKTDVVEQVNFLFLVAEASQVHPLGLQRTGEALHAALSQQFPGLEWLGTMRCRRSKAW